MKHTDALKPALSLLLTACALAATPARARCDGVRIDPPTDPIEEAFHVGNGGDVVTQRVNGQVVHIELLDFYEGRQLRDPFAVDLGASELGVYAKVALALARLDRFDALRAARYRGWLDTFASDACFMSGIQLVDIPDSQHVQLPAGEGWGIEQIAVHAEPLMPEDYRYVVNKDLWDLLDADGQAGLVMHELLYRDAVTAGVEHSRGVRALNRYVDGNALAAWDLATYVDRLRRVEMGDWSYRGLWIDLKASVTPTFRDDGTLAAATAVRGARYASPWGALRLDCGVCFDALGALRAFSVQTDTGATVTVGGNVLAIVPPSAVGRSDACGTADAPRFDVSFTDPTQPDVGRVKVMTTSHVPLSGAGFAAVLTEGLTFEDGRLVSGVVDPDAGPAFVDEGTTRCELKRGGLRTVDAELVQATVRKCKITRGANTFYIAGVAQWAAAQPTRILAAATLATPQALLVGAVPVTFANTEALSFYPTGEVKRGRLSADTTLPNEDGAPELYLAGAAVTLTTDGRVLRHPLP